MFLQVFICPQRGTGTKSLPEGGYLWYQVPSGDGYISGGGYIRGWVPPTTDTEGQIITHTVGKRAVRTLLECFLVRRLEFSKNLLRIKSNQTIWIRYNSNPFIWNFIEAQVINAVNWSIFDRKTVAQGEEDLKHETSILRMSVDVTWCGFIAGNYNYLWSDLEIYSERSF